MPNLITKVDRTTGTYDNVFIYTMNASFNGISGDINSAQIQMQIPNYFTVYLGDIELPVQETIIVKGEETTSYTFDFGSITDLGIAVRIGFGLTYNYEVDNGESFELISNMFINDELILTNTADEITLAVTPRFALDHNIVLPTIDPAPGGQVYYRVKLQNYGDLGGAIQDVEISIEHPDIVILDNTYEIKGADASTGTVTDDSADGIIGSIVDNQVIFSIPSYRGEIYEFIYRATISSDSLSGDEVNTTATWTYEGGTTTTDLDSFVLSTPVYSATTLIYGPEYIIPNEYACYQLYIANNGNQALDTVTSTISLPQQLEYYSFNTGTFYTSQINEPIEEEYYVSYTTNGGVSDTFGPFNTNVNSTVDLQPFLDSGDNLSSLTWEIASLGVGVEESIAPEILSISIEDLTTGSLIFNTSRITWYVDGVSDYNLDNHSINVQDLCILNPEFSVSTGSSPVRPGETITFTMGATCLRTRLQDPIFAMILPYQLEYVGNKTIVQMDFFDVEPKALIPDVSLTYDFNEDGDTLVAFRFRDEFSYDFLQGDGVYLSFDAQVKSSARDTFSTNMLLNTLSSTGKVPSGVLSYDDVDNIADDPDVLPLYAESTSVSNQILLFISTSSNKKVMGSLDDTWLEEPFIGTTLSGGNVDYQLTLSNIGNADITNIEIVDILPHVGDTGVVEIDTPRESLFPIYNISEMDGQIIDTDTEEIITGVTLEYYYSSSYDPVRFGGNFDTIGTDDNWTLDVPAFLTDVSSFKIILADHILGPGQSLVLTIRGNAPVDTPSALVAWNSFAANVTYTNSSGVSETLLAIEPEKVGVTIAEPAADTATITGYAFRDLNGNGYFEGTDYKVNDIGVVLYDEDGVAQAATYTVTSFDDEDGYYEFAGLAPGNYYVGFFIDDLNFKFTSQELVEVTGSKVDPSTGITLMLTLSAGDTLNEINAGFIPINSYSIDTILEVNKSARSMVRNVIYDQMLIGMKYEDVQELITNMQDKEV